MFRKSIENGNILGSGPIGKEHHHEQDRVARRKRLSGTVENRRIPNNWTPVARADFKVDVSSRFPSPVADERTSESGVVAWRGLTSADWTAAFPPPGRDDLPPPGQGNLLRRGGYAISKSTSRLSAKGRKALIPGAAPRSVISPRSATTFSLPGRGSFRFNARGRFSPIGVSDCRAEVGGFCAMNRASRWSSKRHRPSKRSLRPRSWLRNTARCSFRPAHRGRWRG